MVAPAIRRRSLRSSIKRSPDLPALAALIKAATISQGQSAPADRGLRERPALLREATEAVSQLPDQLSANERHVLCATLAKLFGMMDELQLQASQCQELSAEAQSAAADSV